MGWVMDPRSSTLYQSLEQISQSIDERNKQLQESKKSLEEIERHWEVQSEAYKKDTNKQAQSLQELEVVAEKCRSLLKARSEQYLRSQCYDQVAPYTTLPTNPTNLQLEALLSNDTSYKKIVDYFSQSFKDTHKECDEFFKQTDDFLGVIRKLKKEVEEEIGKNNFLKIENNSLKERLDNLGEYGRIELAAEEMREDVQDKPEEDIARYNKRKR